MPALRITDLTPGAKLVLEGTGVVTVRGRLEMHGVPYIELEGATGGYHSLAVEKLLRDGTVRPLIDRQLAARWFLTLRNAQQVADDRPFRIRTSDHVEVLASGTDEDRVRVLRSLYASPYAASAGERRLIDVFENLVVVEIAHVFGVEPTAMITTLHAMHATFSPSALPRPAAPDEPHVVGSFSLDSDELTVGDMLATSLPVAAARGRWLVHIEDDPTFGIPAMLVAVHADASDRLAELRTRLTSLGVLDISSGVLGVTDSAARSELELQLEEGQEVVRERGIAIETDGGTKRAAAHFADGIALLVIVDIGWPQSLES